MAPALDVGGVVVNKLAVLRPARPRSGATCGTARFRCRCPGSGAGDAGRAGFRAARDRLWRRHDDEDFVPARALAGARWRAHLGDWPDWEPRPDELQATLIEDFVGAAGLSDDDATRSLADLFPSTATGITGSAR